MIRSLSGEVIDASGNPVPDGWLEFKPVGVMPSDPPGEGPLLLPVVTRVPIEAGVIEATDIVAGAYYKFKVLDDNEQLLPGMKFTTGVALSADPITFTQLYAQEHLAPSPGYTVAELIAEALEDYQPLDEKGQPNGYAPLGADGKVPAANLPAGGGGAGDMTKAEYDPDDDGVIAHAALADLATSAQAAPWAGITGKPATFAPSAHTHPYGEVIYASDGRYHVDHVQLLPGGPVGDAAAVQWILDRLVLSDAGVALVKARSVEMIVPRRVVNVTGAALKETSSPNGGVTPGANSRLLIPGVGPINAQPFVNLTFTPEGAAGILDYSVVSGGNQSVPSTECVIATTDTTGSALLGVSRAVNGYANLWLSLVNVVNNGVTLRVPDGAPMDAADLSQALSWSGRHWICDTGTSSHLLSDPVPAGWWATPTEANEGSYGIRTPRLWNGGEMRVERVSIQGYHFGYDVNEHLDVANSFLQYCGVGLRLRATSHTARLGKVVCQWCPINVFGPRDSDALSPSGGWLCKIKIEQLGYECYDTDYFGPKWYEHRYVVEDADSNIDGFIGLQVDNWWLDPAAGSGTSYPFMPTGHGQRLEIKRYERPNVPHSESTVETGAALSQESHAGQFNGQIWQQPGATGTDVFTTKRWLPPGVHQVSVVGIAGTTGGILTLDDAHETGDFYATAEQLNTVRSFTVVQHTAGMKTLRFRVATKNSASSGYLVPITAFVYQLYSAASQGAGATAGGGGADVDTTPETVVVELAGTDAVIPLVDTELRHVTITPQTGNAVLKWGTGLVPGMKGRSTFVGQFTGAATGTLGVTAPTGWTLIWPDDDTGVGGTTPPTIAAVGHEHHREFVWEAFEGFNLDYIRISYRDLGVIAGSIDSPGAPPAAVVEESFAGSGYNGILGSAPNVTNTPGNMFIAIHPAAICSRTAGGFCDKDPGIVAGRGYDIEDATYEAEVELDAIAGGTFGVAVNHNGGTAWNTVVYWRALVNQATGNVTLDHVALNETITNHGTYAVPGGITAGSSHVLRLRPDGDSIAVDWDGVEVISYTTAGRPGKLNTNTMFLTSDEDGLDTFLLYPPA